MPDLSGWLFIAAGTLYGVAVLVSLWVLVSKRREAVAWIPRAAIVGLVLHFSGLMARTFGREGVLGLTLREILFLVAFAGISVYLLAHFRYRLEVMGIIILPLVVALMSISVFVPDVPTQLSGRWQISLRVLHIVPAVLAVAFLFVTFATSLIYLVQEHGLKEHKPLRFSLSLPSLERCDRLSYVSLGWGFAFLTLVVATGVITNHYTHRDFSWIPRETLSLLAWGLFAIVIYDRVFAGRWRGRLSAYLSIIGFVAIIMRMMGVGS